MKSISMSAAIVAALMAVSATMVHADGSTVMPAKNAAYITVSGVNVATSNTLLTNLQLLKAKKKHVVEVETAITETGNTAGALATNVQVNGVQMQPTMSLWQVTDCSLTTTGCSINGRFWLDLDAHELLYPGTFIGQPLSIDIYGITGGAPTIASVTARARLVKK